MANKKQKHKLSKAMKIIGKVDANDKMLMGKVDQKTRQIIRG